MSLNIIKGRLPRAQRVVIYGQEGVGKTTLAAGFPSPLILDTEDGSHTLDVARVPVGSYGDLMAALDELQAMAQNNACEFATIIIDTADQLWWMCAYSLMEEYGWKSIESPKYGTGYTQASERFVSILSRLDALVRLGISVVVVCHAKIQKVSPPDTAEFTKYAIKVNATSGQAEIAREKLKEWCDVLLFCRFDVSVNQAEKKAVSSKRVIVTTSAPAWEAKNRLGLPESLPMEAAALAPIWGGVPVAPAPAQAAAPATPQATATAPQAVAATPQAAPATPQASAPASSSGELTEDDKALMVEFFVAHGRLADGQTLADLAPNVATALAARPMVALAKAKAWKGGQA